MRVLRLLPVAVAAALVTAAPASATHSRIDVDVIARGLDNPRHVAVAADGDVYVAESGRGGDHDTSKSCFNSAEGFACTGATGAVTKISRWGQFRVVRGLASFAPDNGGSAIGPHGIYVDGHDLYVTNGGPTAPWRGDDDTQTVLRHPTLVAEEPISRLYGTLLKFPKHGHPRLVADLWRFERDVNPDAQLGNPLIDSNPVDVFADHKRLLVADAGGNTVLSVADRVRAVKVFPNIPMPHPFVPGAIVPMQAVPTGVVVGPDGATYVSQLTGFPFPIGGAKVFRIDPRSGAVTTYASGFTMAMDLAFGRDGTLYVLEIDSNSLLQDGTDGAIWAVPKRGAPRKLALPAGTLTEPGGIAVGHRGDLYVSNHSREAGNGQVLRIDLD